MNNISNTSSLFCFISVKFCHFNLHSVLYICIAFECEHGTPTSLKCDMIVNSDY